MEGLDDICPTIKRDYTVVLTLAKLVGTFPYDLHTFKRSKLFSLWSFVVFGTIFKFLSIGFSGFKLRSNDKVEFYTFVLMKILVGCFIITSALLMYNAFTVTPKLVRILLELNRVQSYFTQLSCQDVAPNEISKKQTLVVTLFLLCNLVAFSFRAILWWKYGMAMTCAVFLINLVSFSTLLLCTNLLDIVKHYLNIINVELINISDNQDKQHYINLYKSRICVLNNMLPENYLCRRKLKILVQLHFSLCKLSGQIVNRTYPLCLFALMVMNSYHLTCTLYLILVLVLQTGSVFSRLSSLIYFHLWAGYNLFVLIWIIRHCESVKRAGSALLELVYHKIIYNESPELNAELTHFLNCICTHKIRFRALDAFEIDYTVLTHMIGAVVTYGVILVQLSFSS